MTEPIEMVLITVFGALAVFARLLMRVLAMRILSVLDVVPRRVCESW